MSLSSAMPADGESNRVGVQAPPAVSSPMGAPTGFGVKPFASERGNRSLAGAALWPFAPGDPLG